MALLSSLPQLNIVFFFPKFFELRLLRTIFFLWPEGRKIIKKIPHNSNVMDIIIIIIIIIIITRIFIQDNLSFLIKRTVIKRVL